MHLCGLKTLNLNKISTFNRRHRQTSKEEPYRINGAIRAREVRVVPQEGTPVVCTLEQALKMAKDAGLDLVEVARNATPPVCKLIDYSKFKYEQKKKQKAHKSNSQKTLLKAIRFSPTTDEHDLAFKQRFAEKFLQEGAKLKAYVHFRGREIAFKEHGELLLLKLAKALEPYGKVEQLPKMEGRRMILIMTSKKSKK